MSAVTAADVRAALKRYYGQPNYGIVFEVAQATGFNARRHLDAMAMGLWPSRGLTLYGIEVKASRYDWRKELEQPQKAEELARFCDYFYVAAPKDVVPLNEVPDKWGLLELRGETIVEAKAASKHEAEPTGRPFLAAIFRAASREVDPETLDALLRKREREFEEKFDQRVKERAEQITRNRHDGNEKWAALIAALNVEESYSLHHDLIPAIRAIHRAGIVKSYAGLRSIEKTLSDALDKIRPVIADLDISDTDDMAVLANRIRRKS
jgi:hypothetical protein